MNNVAFVNFSVRTLSGKTITLVCSSSDTIKAVKAQVEKREGVPIDSQMLISNGKQLENLQTLSECSISPQSTLHLLLRLKGGECPAYHICPEMFDPSYDFDFTNVNDQGRNFQRGGKSYVRPIGAKRVAVKVLGKYDNDNWLLSTGSRDEWPVAYHGTEARHVDNIIQQGFRIGTRNAYGRGIYCSPNPLVAKKYAKQYPYNVNLLN
uniref:Ubiquitin-like domain-containing protein n=1 Tax=Panagrolaimus sp. ES5 TaxID=591445 RepID=A0AC34G6U4_9BILA